MILEIKIGEKFNPLFSRRKQDFKVRKIEGKNLNKKQRIKLLFLKKKKLPPSDPVLLKDAPEIDKLFKRATIGAGHPKTAYVCLAKHYQYMRDHNYETKKGA